MDKYIFKVCLTSLAASTTLYAISLEKSERVQKVIEKEEKTPSFSAEKNDRILNIIHDYKREKRPFSVEKCLNSLEENLSATQQPEDDEIEYSILNINTKNFFDTKANTLHMKFNEHPRFQAESMISICSVLSNYQSQNRLIENLKPESIKAYQYAALIESINFFTNSSFQEFLKEDTDLRSEMIKVSNLPARYIEINKMHPFVQNYPMIYTKSRNLHDLAKEFFNQEQRLPNQFSQEFLNQVNSISRQEKSRESGNVFGLGRF